MKATKSTLLRTALFFMLLIIMDVFYALMCGMLVKYNLMSNEVATGYVATGAAANVAAIRAWWKNNSFTEAAILGDSAMYEQRGLKMIEDGEIEDNVAKEEAYAKQKGLM